MVEVIYTLSVTVLAHQVDVPMPRAIMYEIQNKVNEKKFPETCNTLSKEVSCRQHFVFRNYLPLSIYKILKIKEPW